MTKLLIKKFIANPDSIDDVNTRAEYGRLAGVAGIITNTFLCLLKVLLGLLTGSIAIVADAINNMSDSAASIITVVGFKLASKKGDKEHPYGHARMEYMTGMLIAALVILVGFQILLASWGKVRNPEPVKFGVLLAVFLGVAILIKVWQSIFYFALAKRSKSAALRATGTDSRNDVITTTAVLLSYIVEHLTGFAIDGYMGMLVAVFIIYSGITLIKETMDPLLGAPPDPVLVNKICETILGKHNVLGMHDLIIHDYGPGRLFASVHIEVDAAANILESHEIIDDLETEIKGKLGVEIVGHMDPVDKSDKLVNSLRKKVSGMADEMDGVLGIHDLRIVRGERHINVIFDVTLSSDCKKSHDDITLHLTHVLCEEDPRYELVITYDTDYTSS